MKKQELDLQSSDGFQPEQMQTPDGSRSLLSARQIASLLVTQPKLYKSVYKQWMKLIIQCKPEVLEFIYNSKANDSRNSAIFNYIEVPDYLKELIMDKERNKQECKEIQRPKSRILVSGYIRRIDQNIKQENVTSIFEEIIDISQ